MLIEEQDWRRVATVDPDGARPARPALTVGIGAGDGALEALKALFIAIEDSADMAFVVVQRGDRAAGSLREVLEQVTELAVREVRDGDLLEPERVYVAPAGHAIEIQAGRFALSPRLEPAAEHIAVDTLFRSLARSFGARAVGIVLSGAGADGSQGVQAIARAGGLTLASDPERARVPSMPRAAIASGVIDQVLSPFEMPEALLARSAALALEEMRSEHADAHASVDELTLANA
ncbi:MAG TPA: chemotaxis protein CheB, partial [Polyangiales bacterium]|nr:chemotaxis protein CheB [Polyangiales bacterium]